MQPFFISKITGYFSSFNWSQPKNCRYLEISNKKLTFLKFFKLISKHDHVYINIFPHLIPPSFGAPVTPLAIVNLGVRGCHEKRRRKKQPMAAHNFAICCGCCQPERKIYFLIDSFLSPAWIFCFIVSGLSVVGSCIDFSGFGEGEQHQFWETSTKYCIKNTINPGHALGTRLDLHNIPKEKN